MVLKEEQVEQRFTLLEQRLSHVETHQLELNCNVTMLLGIVSAQQIDIRLMARDISTLQSDMRDVKLDLATFQVSVDQQFKELRSEISGVAQGLRSEIASVERGLRSEIASVEHGLRGEIAEVRTQVGGVAKQVEELKEILTVFVARMS